VTVGIVLRSEVEIPTRAFAPLGNESEHDMATADSDRSHLAGGPRWRPPSHHRPLHLVTVPALPPLAGPMTFSGSAHRCWTMKDSKTGGAKTALATLALLAVIFAWVGIALW
jgi:hypothetical protein